MRALFISRLATILGILVLSTGCGGGGKGGSGATQTLAAPGTVVLPAGFTVDPSTLTVSSGAGTAPVASNGTFTASEPAGGGPATVLLLNAADKVVLLGHVDTDNPAFNDVSPTSTAQELLFLATGGLALPPDTWPWLYGLLAAAPETATVARVIGAQMATNPTAVGDMDPVILAAVDAAVASFRASASSGVKARALPTSAPKAGGAPPAVASAPGAGAAAFRVSAAAVTSKLSITTFLPESTPDPGAGLIVAPSDDRTGIVITNTSRINRFYFVYRTGHVPAGGKPMDKATELPQWALVASGLLPSVTGFSGFTSTIYEFFKGNPTWKPVTTPTITLPLTPTDAVADTYQVFVVGMGGHTVALPADLTLHGDASLVSRAQTDMTYYTVLKELLWPFVTKILPVHPRADIWKDSSAIAEIVKDFAKAAGSAGLAWQNAILSDSTQAWSATSTLLKAAPSSSTIKKGLYGMAVSLTAGVSIPPNAEERINNFADKFFPYVKVADLVLTSVETVSISYEIIHSNSCDLWGVRATTPTLTLVPPSASISSASQTPVFSVTVTGYPSAKVTYVWGQSAYGQFKTGCGTTGNPIDCYGNQVATYALTGTTLPKVPADTFILTVYGPDTLAIGTVTGTVHFTNVALAPAYPFVPRGTHQAFTVALTNGAVPAGTTVTWTLTGNGTLNGGSAPVSSSSLSVDYLAPMTEETNWLDVALTDAKGALLGRTSTPITVISTLDFSPNGPVALNAHQPFTVSGINGFVLPAGGTYRWTVTGAGTLSGGKTMTTTAPTVTYLAPGAVTEDTLEVQVFDQGGTLVSRASVTIPVGVLVWRGTSISRTNGGPAVTSQVVVKEYRVDTTHVYFAGTSSDSQGFHYTLRCGSVDDPGTVVSNGGVDTITVASGCTFDSLDGKLCTATTPTVTLTETEDELFFPGATYVWSALCSNARTVDDAFTMTHD